MTVDVTTLLWRHKPLHCYNDTVNYIYDPKPSTLRAVHGANVVTRATSKKATVQQQRVQSLPHKLLVLQCALDRPVLFYYITLKPSSCRNMTDLAFSSSGCSC